jgi:two-component system OmpR family sensor kinase
MSLQIRLVLAAGIVALVALVLAAAVVYASLGSYLNGEIDETLAAEHTGIESCLNGGARPTPDLVADDAPGAFLEERTATGRVVGAVAAFSVAGRRVSLTEPLLPSHVAGLGHPRLAYTGAETPPAHTSTAIFAEADCAGGGSGTIGARRAHAPPAPTVSRAVVYFTTGPSRRGGPSYRVRASWLDNGTVMFLAIPLSERSNVLNRLLVTDLSVGGGALAAALLLGWWLVRLGMRPLAEIERTAEMIGEADLGARIAEPPRPTTEIGRLARVLNSMLSRLQDAFAARDRTEGELRASEERMRQFLADASHELRTPLAAVSAYTELFNRSASDHPEDLPRILGGIRTESARMGRLVSDLLLLANLDEGRAPERVPVELVSVAAQSIEAATTIRPGWPIVLVAREPVEVIGDGTQLRQVLDNLLANVHAHTPDGTEAEVVVRGSGGEAEIEVTDHGPGMADADMHRAFERFFRTDSSRARTSSGGSGLGLAIVRAIAVAHGGSATASRPPGGGARFTIRLPRSSQPDGESGPEGD